MDYSELNNFLTNLEIKIESDTEPEPPLVQQQQQQQQAFNSNPQQAFNSNPQQAFNSNPQQAFNSNPQQAFNTEDKNTLKDETNKRLNSYNNQMGFQVAHNKQSVAGQMDFKSFMIMPQSNVNSKNNINSKLSSRENFVMQGQSPIVMDMKPKLTRSTDKAKSNF